jgi:hypothetical protein
MDGERKRERWRGRCRGEKRKGKCRGTGEVILGCKEVRYSQKG